MANGRSEHSPADGFGSPDLLTSSRTMVFSLARMTLTWLLPQHFWGAAQLRGFRVVPNSCPLALKAGTEAAAPQFLHTEVQARFAGPPWQAARLPWALGLSTLPPQNAEPPPLAEQMPLHALPVNLLISQYPQGLHDTCA